MTPADLHPNATADDLEDFEERAAIMEYLGAMPRKQAELVALALIRKKISGRSQVVMR